MSRQSRLYLTGNEEQNDTGGKREPSFDSRPPRQPLQRKPGFLAFSIPEEELLAGQGLPGYLNTLSGNNLPTLTNMVALCQEPYYVVV